MMPSVGWPSHGSFAKTRNCKGFFFKTWLVQGAICIFTLSGSPSVVVEASAKSAELSCPCFYLYLNIILQTVDLARGPPGKVRFVLGHRLALVFRLRNSVEGD